MRRLFLIIGLTALTIAPSWGQEVPTRANSDLLLLTLQEHPEQISARFGTPAQVDDSLPNYFSWYFKTGVRDEHDFSYILCFSRSEGALVSMTRNFDPEEPVDDLFPAGSFTAHYWPSPEAPQFSLRLRNLSGDRVLMAMGSAEAGKPTGQLILMRRSVLSLFFPWLKQETQ